LYTQVVVVTLGCGTSNPNRASDIHTTVVAVIFTQHRSSFTALLILRLLFQQYKSEVYFPLLSCILYRDIMSHGSSFQLSTDNMGLGRVSLLTGQRKRSFDAVYFWRERIYYPLTQSFQAARTGPDGMLSEFWKFPLDRKGSGTHPSQN